MPSDSESGGECTDHKGRNKRTKITWREDTHPCSDDADGLDFEMSSPLADLQDASLPDDLPALEDDDDANDEADNLTNRIEVVEVDIDSEDEDLLNLAESLRSPQPSYDDARNSGSDAERSSEQGACPLHMHATQQN